MENIEKDAKYRSEKITTKTTQLTSNKTKKTKKSKKTKEKKCTGLKELLEQINQEKLEKIKLQEKVDKNCKINSNSTEGLIQYEEKSKDNTIKDHKNIFNSFISGSTVATSSHEDYNEIQKYNFDKFFDYSNKYEYIDLKPNYLIKNSEFSEDDNKNDDEQPTIKIKISSPILDYYDGFDKILSETHKGSVDMTNSMNFIKKEDFVSNNSFSNMNNNNNNNNVYMDSNIYINPEEIDNFQANINIIDNKNDNDNDNTLRNDITNNSNINIFKENINNNIISQDNNNNTINNDVNELKHINLENNKNNMNDLFEDSNYFNVPFCQIMDYYNNTLQENIQYSKFSFDNNVVGYNSNINRYNNKKFKKDKSKYKKNNNIMPIRKGDWKCRFCLNLNFSFRTFCNRCKARKEIL